MSDKWILKINAADYPAASLEEVRTWARAKRVPLDAYLYSPREQKWLLARDVPEIASAIAEGVVAPAVKQRSSTLSYAVIAIVALFLFVSFVVSRSNNPTVDPAAVKAASVRTTTDPNGFVEQSRRIAAEKRKAEAERRTKEVAAADMKWKRSKAGRLCEKNRSWSREACETIAKGKIQIGFTEAQVTAAWGRPERKNVTTHANHVSEQWVYGSGNYVYFDEGIMTTVQTQQ